MLQVLSNLNEVDLLPGDYRKRGVQRRTYLWRLIMVALFAGFFTGTALLQRNHHAYVLSQLVEVEAQYAQAVAHNAKSAEIKAQLLAERSSAELLTFLRHPWPRTQIIAAILEPLTDSITLTDWQIMHETIHHDAVGNAPPADAKKPADDKPARRARDLKRALCEAAERQEFVLLAGHATEAAALHEYLARLGANPLFLKIDLRSMENVVHERNAGQMTGMFHFTARAILKPGHGQLVPSKPSAPSIAFSSGPVAQHWRTSEVRQ